MINLVKLENTESIMYCSQFHFLVIVSEADSVTHGLQICVYVSKIPST